MKLARYGFREREPKVIILDVYLVGGYRGIPVGFVCTNS